MHLEYEISRFSKVVDLRSFKYTKSSQKCYEMKNGHVILGQVRIGKVDHSNNLPFPFSFKTKTSKKDLS